MSIKSNLRHVAAAAALGLAGIGAAQAHTIAAVTAVGNQVIGGLAVIAGTTTPLFANAAGQRFIVHFAAECAVNAPAGNTTAWTDVDIQVLNAAGAVVQTLAPTVGTLGAFCSADGSAGLSGWQSNAVIAIGGTNLPAGNYRVRAVGRLNNGATQASYGERTLIVTR
jgi:hypothetical protein